MTNRTTLIVVQCDDCSYAASVYDEAEAQSHGWQFNSTGTHCPMHRDPTKGSVARRRFRS